ncbi:hypothetical protein NOM01_09950 [Sporolactobacillus sp. STSJ-5]|uniref:L,D-transpeptidase family protein n=1 Tax=Sporolactobacillus sp. STSJ-5 TaxID=2965076 RepID=UPI0021078B6A|nr:L,D-transpeptidase family protein [Sporolactobacillus sp. STSJ-5]MCQ2010335.1 hypothetical protein [Sporolactobacillus sp. STSJ-5]
MKKILILLLLSTLILSLTACADKGSVKPTNSKPESSSAVEQSDKDKAASSVEKKESTQSKQDKEKTAKKDDGSNNTVPLKASSSKSTKSSNQTGSSSTNHSSTSKKTVSNKSSESEDHSVNQAENKKAETKPESPKSESQKTNVQNQPIIAETNLAKRTNQILTVVASGIHAHITLWTKNGDTWGKSLETNGFVGKYGVGKTHEGSMRTPYGAYSLGFAFGTSNPGTKLPFRKITSKSWWVEDSHDPNYNTWQEGDHFNKPSEHLADYPVQYKYAIVINYNTARTPWAGSGFFVHVSNGGYTAGCVSLPQSQMVRLLNTVTSGAYILNVTSESQIKGF